MIYAHTYTKAFPSFEVTMQLFFDVYAMNTVVYNCTARSLNIGMHMPIYTLQHTVKANTSSTTNSTDYASTQLHMKCSA